VTLKMSDLEDRLGTLQGRGVRLVDPRQVYVADDIDLERISPGATLYPGARLIGSRTFLGPGAKVGSEGPATVADAVLAEGAEIASGYVEGAVLLRGARLGSNAHVRPATLIEEQASTAHAVGLKQTILMAYVTTGSLINLCDALVSGGRSRADHSEIGSGFIHFNFTPYGPSGDKATPTLVGDVERGVFLREERIFLGGLSGIAGPQKVGFGAFTVAGQIIREEVPEGSLFGSVGRNIVRTFERLRPHVSERKVAANLQYIGQLFALKAWYTDVRLRRACLLVASDPELVVIREAVVAIDHCIAERISRLRAFLATCGRSGREITAAALPCPLPIASLSEPGEHLDWVRALAPGHIATATAWLRAIAQSVSEVPIS
jgi:hypothetical protein